MDFTKPWDFGDVTFSVEEKRLYVNKGVLAMSSEVFRTMFTSEFKERKMTEIRLPDKKFEDFLQLMQILHPPHGTCVDDTNAACLLPLAHEYQIHHVMERCVQTLIEQPASIHNLILAEKFSLPELRQVCIEFVKSAPSHKLEEDPEYEMINKDTLFEVFQYKLKIYESKEAYESANFNPRRVQKEPQLELIRCALMFQKPSIKNLFLAEKYEAHAAYGKCLQYLKDTQLKKLQREPGFADLKSETLMEVLKYKVNKRETMHTEVTNLASWERINKGGLYSVCECKRGTNTSCSVCEKYPFCRPTDGDNHRTGTTQDCLACNKYRLEEICEVVKKY